MRRWHALAPIFVAGLAGCGLMPMEAPPHGGPPMDINTEPIGPVVELGRGQYEGQSWIFVAWESRMGDCTGLRYGGRPDGGSSCGGELGSQGEPLALGSMGSGGDQPTVLEGAVSEDVARVVIQLAGGEEVEADLMSLRPFGRQGRIFLAHVAPGLEIRRIVALGADGEELGSEPVLMP